MIGERAPRPGLAAGPGARGPSPRAAASLTHKWRWAWGVSLHSLVQVAVAIRPTLIDFFPRKAARRAAIRRKQGPEGVVGSAGALGPSESSGSPQAGEAQGLRAFPARARRFWPGPWIHAPLLFTYWAALMVAIDRIRIDHVLVAAGALALGFASAGTARFLRTCFGYALVGFFFDASRFIERLGLSSDRVLVCQLRRAELAVFGVGEGAHRQTLQDYFLRHHSTAADLFFAVPYGFYLVVAALFAVWLYRRDEAAASRYCWAFLAMNLLGFATYHLIPAAPPWYIHTHGCAVDLSAHASEGQALARVDALLNIQFFRGMYGRASEVFGAIPSLHAAYPLILAVEGWRWMRVWGRALSVFYVAWMAAAAVYLDHHWIIDLAAGWLVCALAVWLVRRWLPDRAAPRALDESADAEGIP